MSALRVENTSRGHTSIATAEEDAKRVRWAPVREPGGPEHQQLVANKLLVALFKAAELQDMCRVVC